MNIVTCTCTLYMYVYVGQNKAFSKRICTRIMSGRGCIISARQNLHHTHLMFQGPSQLNFFNVVTWMTERHTDILCTKTISQKEYFGPQNINAQGLQSKCIINDY